MPRVEGGGEVGGGVSGGREAVPVGEDSRGFDDPFLSFFFLFMPTWPHCEGGFLIGCCLSRDPGTGSLLVGFRLRVAKCEERP